MMRVQSEYNSDCLTPKKEMKLLRKKQTAYVLASVMALTCLNMTPVIAQENIITEISSEESVEITVNSAVRKDSGAIEVNVDAQSVDADDITYKFEISVINSDNNKIAGYETIRLIKSEETVPVKFYTDTIGADEDIKIDISCYNESKKHVYIASYGNDNAQGTKYDPLKTLDKAIGKISEYDANGKYKDAEVIIDGGIYSVNKTVTIPALENITKVTLKAEDPDDKPVFTGGVSVKGADFKKVTDSNILAKLPKEANGKVYSLNLSDYGMTLNYSNGSKTENDPAYTILYYNGNSKQIARYPNEGYAVGSVRVGKDAENKLFTWKSDAIKDWTDLEEAWLRGWPMCDWNLHRGKIIEIADSTTPDTDSNITGKTFIMDNTLLSFAGTDEERPIVKTDKRWYIYNLLEELDCEGEYVIRNNVLYYYPSEADVSSGAFNRAVINLNTDKNDMLKIESNNVTVENLAFDNSKGLFINAEADNVSILGCEFKNNAQHAAKVDGNNNLVSACDFHNLGGRGILMSGGDRQTLTPSESVLENCYFYITSQVDRTNCPPMRLEGCGITARRNTICDTPHSACAYSGNNHIIEYNDFYNCLTDNAEDAGIIYTGNSLSNLGTTIRKNYFHDTNSGLGAIYWDDRLSGQSAFENVFDGVRNALLIHGGVCNTFSNNLVIEAQYGAKVRGKGRMIKVQNQEKKYNAWDEIGDKYNPYSNVFMAYLEGNYHNPTAYPTMPWRGEIWQKAYSNVLKYVNNKTNDIAEETTFQNNYFVNMEPDKSIYPYAGTAMSDITSGGNVLGADSLTEDRQALYAEVVNNSGIYNSKYRAVK